MAIMGGYLGRSTASSINDEAFIKAPPGSKENKSPHKSPLLLALRHIAFIGTFPRSPFTEGIGANAVIVIYHSYSINNNAL